jgi:uncharacterized membrane protein YcfT
MFNTASSRIPWVDYAKGICIILVVMMHSTLGVEKALGVSTWIGLFIEWARPFRMPDFFLISGLFLARRINAPWPQYVDTKILYFAYFYVLWMSIQFLFKGHGVYAVEGLQGLAANYGLGLIEPFGTLWFIYLLAAFFAVTKLLARISPLAVFLVAAVLEVLPIHTGWTLFDEFAARYVYFFAGYWLSARIFNFADTVQQIPLGNVSLALLAWALFEAIAVFGGFAALPGAGLVLGFAGAAAVVAAAVALSRLPGTDLLRSLGANSIVIYLAFFLFMAASRSLLLRTADLLPADIIAIAVTACGVAGPILLHGLVKRTPLRLLFERPAWARVAFWQARWHSVTHDQKSKPCQP